MPHVPNRAVGRNVYIFLKGYAEPIGGLIIDIPHITNRQFLRFISILVHVETTGLSAAKAPSLLVEFSLEGAISREEKERVLDDEEFIQMGNYYISPAYPEQNVHISVSREPYIDRIPSPSLSPESPVDNFTRSVRARDQGCVIAHIRNRRAACEDWLGWDAVHIFPLFIASHFLASGLADCITDTPAGASPLEKLNSVQNGILLQNALHLFFSMYRVGIDVDAGYKVVVFHEDDWDMAGKVLAPSAQERGESGARDKLLRWHLRMCVLANMRGLGERIWQNDGDEEEDDVETLLIEDASESRIELEMQFVEL